MGGRVVGLWAWDPDTGDIDARVFGDVPKDTDLGAGRAAARQVIADLGHGKAFSLDSDDRLRRRLARVQAAPARQ